MKKKASMRHQMVQASFSFCGKEKENIKADQKKTKSLKNETKFGNWEREEDLN